MSTDQYKDCLRLTDADRRELFRALAATPIEKGATSKRKHDRVDYRGREIPFWLAGQESHERHRYIALSRNVSASGIALLHGGFAYQGAACGLTLTSIHGQTHELTGTVMHCRLIRGRVHELGVKFSDIIEVESFVSPGEPIFSTLATANKDAPVVLETYISGVRKRCTHLVTKEDGASIDEAAEVFKMLQQTGPNFGYAELSKAASSVLDSLSGASNFDPTSEIFRELQDVAARLTPRLKGAA